MRSLSTVLVAVVSLVVSAHGKLYENVEDLPAVEYDYVIVGAGTAGSVLANRLTESPDIRVLVLEAGSTHVGVTLAEVPLLCPRLGGSQWDWNYTTVPQAGYNGRALGYPRGKVVGGSSTINYMLWTVGSQDDWNLYSKLTKSGRWAWNTIQPLIRRVEKLVAPNDRHNTVCFQSTRLKGLPNVFPFQLDMNDGNTIGVGWIPAIIADGRRISAATAYLAPALERPNLSVLLHAHVTKIIKTDKNYGKPLFRKVTFATNATSSVHTVTAKREIILSAGAFNTPQILLLSGIGDRTELTKLGIDTVLDLPSVGKNMSDHPFVPNVWSVNSNDTFQRHTAAAVLPAELALWNATGAGPLSWTLMNHVAWLRLPENDPIFKNYTDPSNGPTSAHHELLFSNGYAARGAPPPGDYMTVSSVLISPASRGTVALNSSNPFDPPLIDRRWITHPFDIYTMIQSVKAAKQFVSAKAWGDYAIAPYGDFANANTDAEIEAYIRANAVTVDHALGTAAMSPRGAPYGVVDPDMRVKGAVGLRVVDASVIPQVPSAHTQAPVYVIAEAAAELLKSGVAEDD